MAELKSGLQTNRMKEGLRIRDQLLTELVGEAGCKLDRGAGYAFVGSEIAEQGNAEILIWSATESTQIMIG